MNMFLRIALWNANGLLQHKDEVTLFLKGQHIDIPLISETHFTAESYFKIPNFRVYSTTHPDGTTYGGTAIIIKQTIDHHELQKYEENHLQATSIKVRTFPYDLSISAVYFHPRHNIKKEQFGHFFSTLGQRFLAGGDYNSKNVLWGSRLTTTKGKELVQDNNYSYVGTSMGTIHMLPR
jgi:exonuclease III